MNNLICTVCGNPNNNKPFTAREMMIGYGDEFEYFECANCGCLQISKTPNNLSKYYPTEYYSYSIYTKKNALKDLKFKLNSGFL